MIVEQVVVEAAGDGERLDKYLAGRFPEVSRTRLARAIKSAALRVNEAPVTKPSQPVRAGDRIEVTLTRDAAPEIRPEPLPIDVLWEDAHLAFVVKPAGMLTHPTFLHTSGTLVNALLARFGTLSDFHEDPIRPGIVHRLDQETSGVLVVAHDRATHRHLAAQFRDRRVRKVYHAVCEGRPTWDEELIDEPLARSPRIWEQHVVDRLNGRPAQTLARVTERFAAQSLLELHPRTGRQHQLRVHLKHRGHPLLCDPLYGRRRRFTCGAVCMARLALHAFELTVFHPQAREFVTAQAPLPADFAGLLDALRVEARR